MGQALVLTILGAIGGAIAGGIITALAPPDAQVFLRNTLCVVIGAGSGMVAGAVLGGAHAIADAIRDRIRGGA